MEKPISDEGLYVLLNDNKINETQFKKYLRDYATKYGWEIGNRRREYTPYSILVTNSNNEKLDLDELWLNENNYIYISNLLNNDQTIINLLYERTVNGAQGFRYVIQFLFLYNITRIHKKIEKDSEGVIYNQNANKIFNNINPSNIIYNKLSELTEYEKILINIMNEEAQLLVPDGSISENIHPFSGISMSDKGYFYQIVKSKFYLFLNRVTLRYYKTLINNKMITKKLKGGAKFLLFIEILLPKTVVNKIFKNKNIIKNNSENIKKITNNKLNKTIVAPPDIKELLPKQKKDYKVKVSKLQKEIKDNFKIKNGRSINGRKIGKDLIANNVIYK